MPKFELKIIKAIKGVQTFEELFIDDVGQLEKFKQSLVGTTYQSEFMTLMSYMNFVADNGRLPDKKFKMLSGANGVKEYEFKSKHLRIYCVSKVGGKIVFLGGLK